MTYADEVWNEHRSIWRFSPQNEAEQCETVEECQECIESELKRDEPREYVIALLNQRKAELEGG